jgi:hypothetical protein
MRLQSARIAPRPLAEKTFERLTEQGDRNRFEFLGRPTPAHARGHASDERTEDTTGSPRRVAPAETVARAKHRFRGPRVCSAGRCSWQSPRKGEAISVYGNRQRSERKRPEGICPPGRSGLLDVD